jgi:hypothetical protein
MKASLILFAVTLLFLQPLSAQENYGQNLVDALYYRQYADALDYYARYKDSIQNDADHLAYKAITSAIFNKRDSAIAYLNILLNEYTYADSGGEALTEDWFYEWLISMYRCSGDYRNAICRKASCR